MDGVSFLKHFRQIQPDVPRIILSATTDFATLMAAVNEAGIHRYLVKPWDDVEIVAVVRDALSFHDRVIEDRLLAEQKRSERGQLTPEEIELSLKEWKSWGLDGVEAIYPMYTPEQTAFFERMATKYNFVRTGGSDFHGENKPHIKIGTGTGKLNVPDSLLEPLLECREKICHREAP
jgi:response regulator RpfG family c-di-GMP phosphodiesterase